MVAVKRELDFELCRMILLKLEELWDIGMTGTPDDYMFEGYGVENILYNINKLASARLVKVRGADDYHREILSVLPTGFTEMGWRFVALSKDDARWSRAVAAVDAQDGPESIVPLKVELFREMA